MRFYGREEELKQLQISREMSKIRSRFTVVTGRRRIGKTSLILKSVEDTRYVYLFVSRVTQPILCKEFQSSIEEEGIELPGSYTKLGDLLKALMIHSRNEWLTLIIDEFQDLEYVDRTIFQDLQKVWDRYKEDSHLNLIVSGSAHSMMTRLFENDREPLFGRPTSKIALGPLPVSTMMAVLRDHNKACTSEDMLTFYMLTGGVPLYMEALMDNGAVTSKAMLEYAVSLGSVFIADGREALVSEFGRDYRIYFSIMQLLSSGKTSRSEIEDVLGTSVGPYLKRLEEEYGFVRHISPVFSEPNSRNTRWTVSDMYLRFYFRFIRPGASLIESGRYDLLMRTILPGIPEYEGRVLEDLFRRRISEEGSYTGIGSYWSRKGDVEIDIVVLDDLDKRARLIEVKRNPKKIDISELMSKGARLAHELKDYSVSYEGLSEDDVMRESV